jgi:hypothetical protein
MPSSHDLEEDVAPVTLPTPPPVSQEVPASRVIASRADTIPAPPPVMNDEDELPPVTERTPKA